MTPDPAPCTWEWRLHAVSDIQQSPSRRQALVQALTTAAIGLLFHSIFGHHVFAILLWSFAGLLLGLGLCWPGGYRHVHRFGSFLRRLVGRLLLYVLLVPPYYLLFFPVSLWLRARGHDSLRREPRNPRYTCWVQRLSRDEKPDYRRQFLIEDHNIANNLRLVHEPKSGRQLSGADEGRRAE